MCRITLRECVNSAKVVCLILTAFAVMFPAGLWAQTLFLGNCKKNVVTYLAVSSNSSVGSSIYYPQSAMAAYKECKIVEVCVFLDNAVAEGTAKVFLARSLDEEPDYEQAFSSEKGGWHTVTLEKPYEIDGNGLYIGYELTGQRYLPYANAFVSNEEWIRRDKEGWARYEGIYSAAMYATVAGEKLPPNNVRLGTVKMPGYVKTSTPVKYEGEFKNLGVAEVNSLTFSYLVDGKEISTETVGGLNVKPRESGTFTLNGHAFEQEGSFDMQLRIASVNEGDDAVPEDNESPVRKTICNKSFTPRKTLLEMFSTERCTNCPGAHESIARVLEGATDVVEICHHAGYYTDDFTLPESLEYEWFYAQYRLYAPAMMFDRTNFGDSYPEVYSDGVPLIPASGKTAEIFHNEAVQIPAFTTVAITSDVDEASRLLNLHVQGEPLLPVDDKADIGLYVWLTEDSVFSKKQAGATQGFWQRHVARKSLTPVWGMPIDLKAGFSADFAVAIPEEWNISNMSAVAFVAYRDANDKNGCKVLNAEHLKLLDTQISGITDATAGGKELKFDVFNLSGHRVLTKASIEQLNALGKGIYIVNGRKYIK